MKKIGLFFITLIIFIMIFLSSFITVDLITFANNKKYIQKTINNDSILVDSSLFTKKEINQVYEQTEAKSEHFLDNFTKVLDNENLELYLNSESGAIRIKNKTTGYFWSSDATDIDYDNITNVAKKKIQSAFRVLYYDEKGSSKEIRTLDSGVNFTYTVNKNNNEIIFNVKFTKIEIEFEYKLTLSKNKLNLYLDNTKISEKENKISSLTFFPYLGSAYTNRINGYIFVPSGSGALIRYSELPTISAAYETSFYGNDANRTINNEGETLSLPIYGIVHGINQDAVLTEIKDGSSFAKFVYSPSNIDQGYHLAYPKFNLREPYNLNIPSAGSILMIPDNFYHHDIEIEYTFLDLDKASYVGLAKEYQNILEKRNIIERNTNDDENISMHLEVFGRDYEKGLILKKYYNMTTTKDIINFNKYLNSHNITNIFYTLKAFTKGGYSNQSAKNYQFDKRLGNIKDLKDLETYLYYNPIESYNSQRKFPTNTLVNIFNEKNYVKVGTSKYKFYADVKTVNKYTKEAIKEYQNSKYLNIAIDGLTTKLYGDKNNKMSRTDTLEKYQNILSEYKMPLYSPNYYFLNNTSKYLNTPLFSERIRVYTDSVPFIQILLRGYIDYYSPYINFSSNLKMDVLKCIEFGCNPAYLVTNLESYLLVETLSSNYYATTFATFKENILSEYEYINNALKHVINKQITNREILENGISLVTYENGKQIVVNYTSNSYTYKSQTVNPMDYMVI